MNAANQGRLLVVGAGMATAYLLEELACLPHGWSITVIGEEPRACYNRVLLSRLLAGEIGAQDIDMLPDDCAARFVLANKVKGIDTRQRRVECSDGATYEYDALVLATGASVAEPGFANSAEEGVRVVRTVADVTALRAPDMRRGAGRAVVVGGGLLGLEAAHGLHELGLHTTVVHRNPTLMNRQLDAEGGHYLQRMLEQRRLNIRTGATPVGVRRDSQGKLQGLALDDGSSIDCEQIILATGILPRMDLARDAGVACDRGILVDARLRTATDHVFALGECCQYREQTFGLVAPVRAQAAVLARSLAGVDGPAFEAKDDWPVQLKISGVDIFRAGEIGGAAEQLVLRDPAHGVYRRLAVKDDRLVGALLVGDRAGATWYAELIREQASIAALRRGLMFGRDVAEALEEAVAA